MGLAAAVTVSADKAMTDGMHTTNYPSGEKQYESNYKNGKLDGLTTEFEQDGSVKGKYQFQKDMLISRDDTAPKRDMGPIAFLFRPLFWVIVLAVGTGLWFIFSKVILKNKF